MLLTSANGSALRAKGIPRWEFPEIRGTFKGILKGFLKGIYKGSIKGLRFRASGN